MKAAMCQICGKQDNGAYVTFANYKPLPEGVFAPTGHPHGLEYFCGIHLNAALQLTGLSSDEAVDRINESDISFEL